jgi:uncharacterized protein with PQ loop repeat
MLTSLVFHPYTYFALAILVVAIWILQPSKIFKDYIFERDISVYTAYELPIGAEDSVVNQLLASRSGLAIRSWDNFKHNPMIGVGFGLPTFRVPKYSVPTVAGLPVALPYEKGFVGTAVLEEIGIVGALLLLILLYNQFKPIIRTRSVELIMLFLVAIFINFGEFSYFSTGSMMLMPNVFITLASSRQ